MQISLRQNPVKERIKIDLPNNDAYSYKLYLLSGQLIANGILQKNNLLNISAPKQKGMYVLVVQNNATEQLGLCKILIE